MELSAILKVHGSDCVTAHLSFDPAKVAPEQACVFYAMTVLRILSSLKGRAEAVFICNDCLKEHPSLSSSRRNGTYGASPRKTRSFHASCRLTASRSPRLVFKAHGFGFLAKNIGKPLVVAARELRLEMIAKVGDDHFSRMIDLVAKEIGEYGNAGTITLSNHDVLAAAAIVEARRLIQSTNSQPKAAEEVPSSAANAGSKKLHNSKSDPDIFIERLVEMEVEYLGTAVNHMLEHTLPLLEREQPVLYEYSTALLSISVSNYDDLWMLIRGLSPTAKQDPSNLVRACTLLVVNAMIYETLARDELSSKEKEARMERAYARYYALTGSEHMNQDWGKTIKQMAGIEAVDVPPA